jgi:predicted O-linked N-acetylglucosamine transferase (SPINDLY family)
MLQCCNELAVTSWSISAGIRRAQDGHLAYRPAPIQVNYWLSRHSGAEYIDYVMADRVVLPFDQQPFFSEKIVHLPDCYQANELQAEAAPS